jgi:hypothetical protein
MQFVQYSNIHDNNKSLWNVQLQENVINMNLIGGIRYESIFLSIIMIII